MHYLLHTSVLANSACASNFSRKTFTTAIHSRGFPPVCRLLSCCCQHLTPHAGHRQTCMHEKERGRTEHEGKKGRKRRRIEKDGEEMSGRNQESERTEQDKVEDSKERSSGAESIIYG